MTSPLMVCQKIQWDSGAEIARYFKKCLPSTHFVVRKS